MEEASTIQEVGALAFGLVLGWYAYYVNRYRSDKVQITDVATFLGVVGGAAVLALFPAKTDLFGFYGLGLAIGFFLYFLVLVVFAIVAKFPVAFFLDSRVPKLTDEQERTDQRPMARDGAGDGGAGGHV